MKGGRACLEAVLCILEMQFLNSQVCGFGGKETLTTLRHILLLYDSSADSKVAPAST